jgi:hypothetical protein
MQIGALQRRAEDASRLAKSITDSLAKVGLLEVAEECERQMLVLQHRETFRRTRVVQF